FCSLFFQAEDGIRDRNVTGVQTCALPISTMLPTEVIMNPIFIVIRRLGLYDNFAGIIIPSINTATGIFMFRTFFVSVPDELIESARMDGASDGRIFLNIM